MCKKFIRKMRIPTAMHYDTEDSFVIPTRYHNNYPKDDNADERYEILAGTKKRDLLTSEQLPYM